MVITNEHPEILERTEPKAEHGPKVQLGIQMLREASEMRVTSALGTDLTVDLRGAPCGGTAGFGTTPGAVAHWPGGLCLAFPGKNAVNGRIVMGVGDINLTFKTYLTSQIDFTIQDDFVTAIKGDATHRRPAFPRIHGSLGRPQRLLNKKGLHARASRKLAELALAYENTRISVRKESDEADARSLMDRMMLGAGIGDEVEIEARGP